METKMLFLGKAISFFEKEKSARTVIQASDITTVAPWEKDGEVYGATIKTKNGLSFFADIEREEYEELYDLVIQQVCK